MSIDIKSLGVSTKENYLRASSEDFLYLTILPTEKCNFRCSYCYEDFKVGKMSSDVESRLEKYLIKTLPHKRNVAISWFGGEPLLNKNMIIRISKLIRQFQLKYNFTYTGHVTTNGYYLDFETFKRLVKLGVSTFQVSLDGWEELHDKTRMKLGGGKTFQKIWGNLKSFQIIKDNFEIHIRTHVMKDNVSSVRRLCNEVRNQFGGDERFKINIERIKDLGGATNSYAIQNLIAGEGLLEQEILLNQFEELLPDNLVQLRRGDTYICYASMPSHYLIRADGTIGKCTVMLNDKRNSIGYLSKDGCIVVDQTKKDVWTRGFVSLEKDELECPAKLLPL